MKASIKYSINQLRDYSDLFSRSFALEWLKGDFTSLDFKIARYDSNWVRRKDNSYCNYLKYVYKILEKHYKNEYILKNSFLNEWLIKELGKTNSQVFNEFKIGNAIADLVMFNGTSKVFEIKTELDSGKRLTSQIKYYKKVFNQIYLIVPSSKIHQYQDHDSNVGIITFDENSISSFRVIRESETNLNIDFETIMGILHTTEYKRIVEEHFGKLPKMTSFSQYSICKELISKISPVELSLYFNELMKKRNSCTALSTRNHKEFNQLSLALKMTQQKRKDMINSLKEPINI
ncbi:MAG: sce7726 family protein [Bacteroidales bacterium]|nr:sce7726 family protein [Bacteroidales bacterium]